MTAIIMRIITLVMSISVFFTSSLPAYISGEDYKNIPTASINVDAAYGLIPAEEESIGYKIISDYNEWNAYANIHGIKAEDYSEEYFKTNSLALVDITINDGLCELQVINAAEKGTSLELVCNIFHLSGVSVSSATYYLLTIEVSKNTETANIRTNKINLSFDRQ